MAAVTRPRYFTPDATATIFEPQLEAAPQPLRYAIPTGLLERYFQ